jgi:hypothetical protein
MDKSLEQFEYERQNLLSRGRWKAINTAWAVANLRRYYDDVALVRRKLLHARGINTPWHQIRIKPPWGAA